jgi:hypothetical protein
LGCFDLGFALSFVLQSLLIGIERGVVPDIEIIARHCGASLLLARFNISANRLFLIQ